MTISYDKSTNSMSTLVLCVVGVIVSYVAYHLLFERMVTRGEKASEIGLILLSNILNTGVAYLALRTKGKTPDPKMYMYKACRISMCFIGAAWCTQRALRYVTVPTQTIAKSCKPLPTMVLGVWLGRRYNRLQYLCTVVICIGVALFNVFSSAAASGARDVVGENQLPGLLLIVLALVLDGATGAFEDKLVKEMNWSHGGEGTLNLMYFINLAAIPLSLFFTLAMEGTSGVEFVSTHWDDALILSLVGSIGQLFIFHTISTNGALTCCIVTTCRKMFTVILSVLIFKHVINSVQIIGIMLTFSGLAIDIHQKFLSSASKKTRPPTAAVA